MDGPKEYREQRALFVRLDDLLARSGLEREFTLLSLAHRRIDLNKCSAAQRHSLSRGCVLALRSNIARLVTGLVHRDLCIRLADRSLLQWFFQIGRVDGVSAFSKSSSDRFAQMVDAPPLQALNKKLVDLLQSEQGQSQSGLGLDAPINFEPVFFDSTCLKAPIHRPLDWVLLRDATRSLMKATDRIRAQGLRQRMPKEPLSFLSEMNTLCMEIHGKNPDDRRQERNTARGRPEKDETAALVYPQACSQAFAPAEGAGRRNWPEPGSDPVHHHSSRKHSCPGARNYQTGARAHHRRTKSRQQKKILSLYDADVQVIRRGKSNAEVEFGNNLWIGENRAGFIVDYLLEKEKTSDTKQIEASIARLVDEQLLPVAGVWGDRGLHSAANENALQS